MCCGVHGRLRCCTFPHTLSHTRDACTDNHHNHASGRTALRADLERRVGEDAGADADDADVPGPGHDGDVAVPPLVVLGEHEPQAAPPRPAAAVALEQLEEVAAPGAELGGGVGWGGGGVMDGMRLGSGRVCVLLGVVLVMDGMGLW